MRIYEKSFMTSLTFYDGVNEIVENKILLEDKGTKVLCTVGFYSFIALIDMKIKPGARILIYTKRSQTILY
jgi:hypothetical protein